jgi:hypothetical protein
MFLFAYTIMVYGQKIQEKTPKVLIVVSSYGKDAGKSRPGFEMDGFTQAFPVFYLLT